MRVVPYTCSFGGYDKGRTDILCFTSEDFDLFSDMRRNSRFPKICPHLFLPRDTDISIYVDANVKLRKPIAEWVKMLGDDDWMWFRHHKRDTLEEEAKEILNLRMEDPEEVKAQLDHYRETGAIGAKPLTWNGIIVRRHTVTAMRLCETWWCEYTRWTCRDQLSAPVIIGDYAKVLPRPLPRRDNEFYLMERHTRG